MVRLSDIRLCLNCASKVVPVSICNACGTVASRADLGEVDRRIECLECKATNPTQFACDNCSTRFLFEEVAGPPKEQFACLLCGTFIEADAKSCSACGAVYEEEAPPVSVVKKERPKRKIRGEFTDAEVEDIARIPGVGRAKAEALCRAGFNSLWKIKRASEDELGRVRQIGPKSAKAIRESLKFILVLPRRKSKEDLLAGVHACPLCACVTSLFAKSCPDCGAVFDEEEMDDELRREVRGEHEKGLLAFYDIHGGETPDDADLWYARALLLIDMGELPEALKSIDTAARLNPASRRVMTVRARVLSSMQETTQSAQALRESLTGLIQKAEPPVAVIETPDIEDPEAKATFDALESLSALAEKQCPTCGEPVLPDARVCPACGKNLETVSALRELAEELLAETPLPEELSPAGAPLAPEPELKRIVKRPPSLPAAAEPGEEEGTEVEPALPPERAPEVSVDLAVVKATPPAHAMEVTAPRERLAPAPQARFRRGLINGHGLVNGSGRVNGLVNGLGFMDTSVITEFQIPQRSLLFRYAVIGASLLLAFSISGTLIPSAPGQPATIAIDGNPADWNALPKYVDPRPAPDPNVAIQQYGVYQDGTALSFLVQVSGQALGDPTGNDGFYLFFDTDGLRTTGYSTRGTGADFVAEVVGGSGSVTSARLFEFPSDSEMNWSRRVAVRDLAASASGSYLEIRVPTDDLAAFDPTKSTILIAGDNFEGSMSRASVALTAAFGAIRIQQVPLVAVLPTGSTSALRLDIDAVGEIGPSDAWPVGPFSFTSTTGLAVSPSSPQVTLTRASPSASVVVSVTGVGIPTGVVVRVTLDSATAPRPVTVVGTGLEAYFLSVPAGIRIDGAFADWTSLEVPDTDATPVVRGSLDIGSYAGAANTSGTVFMVNVAGTLYDGSVAPQKIARIVPSGGGGVSPPGPPLARVTGEDFTRVFIDSNASDTNGESIGGIYADYMVEVRGTGGAITGSAAYRWQSGWVLASALALSVQKNASAMEGSLGLNPAQLNGTRMVFEASDWSGSGDITSVLSTRSAEVGSTRSSGGPVVMDISGNGKFYFRNSNHASETACTFNKVADYSQGAGPVANISLSVGDTACWYIDPTSGATIPTGDWETLLDIFSGGSGAAYQVRIEIWNKDTDTVAETIGSCLSGQPFGDDRQCLVTGVAEKVLSSDQVVRINVMNSGSGPAVYIEYDDSDTTGDSRATLPLPEVSDVVVLAAVVGIVYLVLRRRRRGAHAPTGAAD